MIYRDPGVAQWGLENILVPLGGEIIEVVAPMKSSTAAGRLLSKRGAGGYMIIMQTLDAAARKNYVTSKKLAKVIWEHVQHDSHAIQYHPKGIKGGMIPELDSHNDAPEQLQDRFSRWHPCGDDYNNYSERMKKHANLSLLGCILRLAPGDIDAEGASKQWEELFGVLRNRDLLAFTNARLGFVPGSDNEPEGLANITIGVRGQDYLDGILRRAKERGLLQDGGAVRMVGIRFYLSHMGEMAEVSRL